MNVTRLDLRNLRRFADASLRPGAGVNLITGDNGAGKTSILEGLHLMAYGRSFRGRVRDGLVRAGTPALEVFVEWEERSSRVRGGAGSSSAPARPGCAIAGRTGPGAWMAAPVAHLGELCAALAVVSFDPGSHVLISGGGEPRRRFLDWGLFHVEPDFLALWRRYSRALRQRNALLKSRASSAQLDAWDAELADAGEPLSAHRQSYLEALQPRYAALLADLAPQIGNGSLQYLPGWRGTTYRCWMRCC
jgi:DNA replication and repair protein RecF